MDKDQTDDHLRYVAARHADEHNHHTAHIPGEGWLCQQCDDDFATWMLDAFGRHDITHYRAEVLPVHSNEQVARIEAEYEARNQ